MSDQPNGTAAAAAPPPDTNVSATRDDHRPVIDSAMETGHGADDEPEMAIGDKYGGDDVPDPDGDGRLTIAEAEELLGGPHAGGAAAASETK
jgi:hypothetical protein